MLARLSEQRARFITYTGKPSSAAESPTGVPVPAAMLVYATCSTAFHHSSQRWGASSHSRQSTDSPPSHPAAPAGHTEQVSGEFSMRCWRSADEFHRGSRIRCVLLRNNDHA